MIRVHPQVAWEGPCSSCGAVAPATGWLITGMWTLARLECPCGVTSLVDLPYGLGAVGPVAVIPATGEVRRPTGPPWYADVTRAAYSARAATNRPVRLTVTQFWQAEHAVLLNCLAPWWGDSVSLLLRLFRIPRDPGQGIVLLVASDLAWIARQPLEGVAETWVLDGGCAQAGTWNDGLHDAVAAECSRFSTVSVPPIFQPADVDDRELQQVTGVRPFPLEQWDERARESPVVTFLARDDRPWIPASMQRPLTLIRRARRLPGRRWTGARLASLEARLNRSIQHRAILETERLLRAALGRLDFGISGPSRPGGLPPQVDDTRAVQFSEEINRDWCRRAARSHVIVGVLGSHMVLPSGHAGAIVQLLPEHLHRNALTDLLVRRTRGRADILRNRLIPACSEPAVVAEWVLALLLNHTGWQLAFSEAFEGVLDAEARLRLAGILRARAAWIQETPRGFEHPLVGP